MGFNSGFKGLIRLEFSRQVFKKIFEYKILTLIRLVGAEMFHADRQTAILDEAITAFHNFAHVPNSIHWETSAVCSQIHTRHVR